MQVQQIRNDYNKPNFQANKLKTFVIAAKSENLKPDVIDIFSIDKTDKNFIEDLLSKISLKKMTDKTAISEKEEVPDTLNYILTKAQMVEPKHKSQCLIAVQNGNKVVGALDYLYNEVPFLKNLVVWDSKNGEIARIGLLEQFFNKAEKINRNRHCSNYKDLVVFTEPKTKGAALLNKFGFKKAGPSPLRERFVLKRQQIKQALDVSKLQINSSGRVQAKNINKPVQIELQNLEV